MIKVYCSTQQHAILALDPVRVDKATNVTKDAIDAVRDYMRSDINNGENAVRYQWKDGHSGKLVTLVLAVEE